MRQKVLSLSLVFVLALGCAAQQKRAPDSAPSVERLRAHVSYLASDALDGRRTGTKGAQEAAMYVAEQFALYKLRPVRDNVINFDQYELYGSYMQNFPYVAGVELGPANALAVTPQAKTAAQPGEAAGARPAPVELRVGEDWMPLGFSSNASLMDLPAVFVKFGIKAAELDYDDYENTPVKGRVAVAFHGSPDGDNPHGQFARHADVRWKAIAARNAGAAALMVVAREENFKDERLARLSYDQSAGEAGLPVVVVSRRAAVRLFQLDSAAHLAEFETRLAEVLRTKRVIGPPGNRYDVRFTIQPPFDFTLNLSTDLVRRSAPAYNVVGILEGSDPALKREAVVIGAHYDHLGRGGQGSLAAREGEVHRGADDNASGVAGMLELARLFSANRARMKRTLVFVAFGGEEEGLLGSNYYVNNPVWPLDKTVAMINMDMIGRMKERRLMIGGVGTAAEWRELITSLNRGHGTFDLRDTPASFEKEGVHNAPAAAAIISGHVDPREQFALTLNEDGYGPSDHSSFYAKRVPVLFFFTGTHDDYHKPSDTAEKIAYEDEARLLSFIAGVVRAVDAEAKRPTYAVARSQAQGRSTGFRVYLGTIPNYAESNDGMKLDGVREDSPAAAAGLKAGDKVIRLAGREVRNVYDYTAALGEMKAGVEYEVEVVRGGATLKLKITPQARK